MKYVLDLMSVYPLRFLSRKFPILTGNCTGASEYLYPDSPNSSMKSLL